jgi:hypothetical protein
MLQVIPAFLDDGDRVPVGHNNSSAGNHIITRPDISDDVPYARRVQNLAGPVSSA